ncbi:Cell division control protein 3 [Astathelohania contejeani]|uniref:Cell division control protein 3 n=1 Tax=Astathelohania contejeani TaxID=164912 RepID=A0ABQ7HZG7_9MICR|nr:Cell division control protein 3 [Thelohania contejeani]
MENVSIGISNLPNQRYRQSKNHGIKYNIMVIGSRGVGKSTLINHLLCENILLDNPFDLNLEDNESYIADSNNIDIKKRIKIEKDEWFNSQLNFQITTAALVDKTFNVDVTITEVDGVGDSIDNHDIWIPIKVYIENLYEKYRIDEETMVHELIKDKRIHVIIYCLEPYGLSLKPLDLLIIQELSEISNVIPVVLKSDLLTPHEQEIFKTNARIQFENEAIKLFEVINPITMECLKSPYFLISGEFHADLPRENIARIYPWGTLDIYNVKRNDMNLFRTIIIKNNLVTLISNTHHFYEDYLIRRITRMFIDGSIVVDGDKESALEFANKIKKEESEIAELKKQYLTLKTRLLQL